MRSQARDSVVMFPDRRKTRPQLPRRLVRAITHFSDSEYP